MSKRTKIIHKGEPSEILSADWHLRDDQPECRLDDFWLSQWEKIHQISDISRKCGNIPVRVAGDFFHKSKPSLFLVSYTMWMIDFPLYAVYGQHDLPYHRFDRRNESGLYALQTAGIVTILNQCHYGQEPKPTPQDNVIPLLWHKFVWDGKQLPWTGCNEETAAQVMDRFPMYQTIVTGDHHKPFTHRKNGRLLVNPGSLTRQASDATHRPRVYLWYRESNTVEPVYLSTPDNAISREHLERQEERKERIQRFTKRFKEEFAEKWNAKIDATSAEERLSQFIRDNNIPKGVEQTIYECLQEK